MGEGWGVVGGEGQEQDITAEHNLLYTNVRGPTTDVVMDTRWTKAVV